MSDFNVGDYAMFDGHEVKITGQLGDTGVFRIEWTDRWEGYKWTHTRKDQLSPVPELTQKAPDMESLNMALQECEAKEREMTKAWDGSVKSIGLPNKIAKTMLAGFKRAEQEYIKSLRELHQVAKAVLK